MTTTTLGNIFDTVTLLDEINAKNSDIKVKYWCNKNVDMLLEDYNYFLKKRNEIYEQYCLKDAEGKYGIIFEDGKIKFNVKKEDVPDFSKELNELINFDCEVDPYILPEEVYKNTVFKPESNHIDIIDYLLPIQGNNTNSDESKVKITLKEICDSVGTLLEINEMNLNSEINYWCFKNLKVLASDYNFYIIERNDICQRYCLKGEDGNYYTIEEGHYKYNLKEGCDASKFDEEFNALLNIECYIEPFVMSVETLESFPNVTLRKGDIDRIFYMLP